MNNIEGVLRDLEPSCWIVEQLANLLVQIGEIPFDRDIGFVRDTWSRRYPRRKPRPSLID